ncbi:hypothetical protein BY458DRAFT_273889 [Sporodiniella umbellata]|nr:hypothetical protein BY458DRAFT_273889 [Sporodiniella umbellata]
MKGGPDNTSASSSESPTTNVHDKKDNISQKDEILYATLLSGSFFHSANDCPSFVFLGNKFKRDGLDYIEKATKESSTNTEEKNIVWPSDIDPVKESTDTYIYSMTGVDRHTSSKLLKMQV